MKEKCDNYLDIQNLKVHFSLEEGILQAVDGVSFSLKRGETLGLVGESGCGKSVTSQAILRIVPSIGKVTGQINMVGDEGEGVIDIASLDPEGDQMLGIRGSEISMIFQEPMTSFSPLYTIGNQIIEAIRLHVCSDKKRARAIAIDMLKKVGIANPEKRVDEYPHELSGGMRQRAMIAMALSCNPGLLIADEPTTALDVTIQAQVLELMKSLQKEFGMSILFITHDLGVVADICDSVAVMYLGKIVEQASVDDIFYNPLHPYTTGLLDSIPRIGEDDQRELASIEGTVPVPINRKPSCGFYERCHKRISGLCDSYNVPLVEISEDHKVSCFLYKEVKEAHQKMIIEEASVHG